MNDSIVEMLQNTPMWSSLTRQDLDLVVETSEQRKFEIGQTIVSKDEPGTGFHLLLEGAAEVRAYGKTVSRLRPGQFFGEMSVLDKQPRPDDVVAVERSRVLFLSTPSFETLVSTNPRIALEMLQGFSRRLRIVDGWLSD